MKDDFKKNNGKKPKKTKWEKNEDDLKKMGKKWRRPKKNEKKWRWPQKKIKNLFLIPLRFRGKPFLGLAQLSKIVLLFSASKNIQNAGAPNIEQHGCELPRKYPDVPKKAIQLLSKYVRKQENKKHLYLNLKTPLCFHFKSIQLSPEQNISIQYRIFIKQVLFQFFL